MISPKKEWNSLYTESAGDVWQNEKEGLKNAAMLMHILSLEFSRIKNIIENEFSTYRNQLELKTRDDISTLREDDENNTFNLTPMNITGTDKFKESRGITPLNTLSTNTSKQSYISPDLFQCESPDFSTALKEPAITELNESPKLNRHKRYYKHKKSKPNGAEDWVKKIIIAESSNDVTPKRTIEDFIDDTPVVPSKKKLPQPKAGGAMKRYKAKAKIKLCNNTLTQMYRPSFKEENDIDATLCEKTTQKDAETFRNDIDATLCEKSTQKDAGTKISDDDAQVISDDDEITENEYDLKYFAQNYDRVPNRNQPAEKEKVHTDNFCRQCNKLGVFCLKHIPESQQHRTCTGFWDIDFSVHDPNEDRDSQKSTIFL